jgi:hypothetical protein
MHAGALPAAVLHAIFGDRGHDVLAASHVDPDVELVAGRERAAPGFSQGCGGGPCAHESSCGGLDSGFRPERPPSPDPGANERARRVGSLGYRAWSTGASPAAVQAPATCSQVCPRRRSSSARPMTSREYWKRGTIRSSRTVIALPQLRQRRRGCLSSVGPPNSTSRRSRPPWPCHLRLPQRGQPPSPGRGANLAVAFASLRRRAAQAGSGGFLLPRESRFPGAGSPQTHCQF